MDLDFDDLFSKLCQGDESVEIEAKGSRESGIRAMREAMSRANLGPPTFESDREKDTFVVTFLFHHFLNEDDVRWLGQFAGLDLAEDEQKALVFVREMGAINNAAYRDINQTETLVTSGHLRRLRELGLLEQKGKSSATYYTPTQRLLSSSATPAHGPGKHRVPTELLAQPQGLTPSATAQSRGLTPSIAAQPRGLEIPHRLAEAVKGLKKRASHQQIESLIIQLCAWRPLRAEQLATTLGRSQIYLTHAFLGPLIRDAKLEYLYPDNPAHPQQAYRTRKLGGQEP